MLKLLDSNDMYQSLNENAHQCGQNKIYKRD